METKNVILKLRTERGMSQDELADKIMVTRQAVSRWENGDTVPVPPRSAVPPAPAAV